MKNKEKENDTFSLLFQKKDRKKQPLLSPLTKIYNDIKVSMSDLNFDYGSVINSDLTSLLYEQIRQDLMIGLVPKILIRGHVSYGKSAVALTLMDFSNKILEEKYSKKINRYKSITSDQIEFLRKVNSGITEQCVTIDEFSQLGESGLNSSTERNWFITYQDLFAQKNIITICCTPRGGSVYELGVNIILDVVGRNEKEKMTFCKIYYNDVSDGSRLLLGSVNIYVGETIEKEWYLKYRKKKFARMDLLDKHGVPDIRKLEFSHLTLKIFNELEKYARLTNRDSVPRELILAKCKSILQEERLMYSMLSESELANDAVVLLGLTAKISKDNKKLMRKPGNSIEAGEIEASIEILKNELKKHLKRHETNSKVLQEYRKIQ